jgi:hypothetical protein
MLPKAMAAGFEQVMGCFHITTAQEYIQSLGFTDGEGPLRSEADGPRHAGCRPWIVQCAGWPGASGSPAWWTTSAIQAIASGTS